MPEEDCEAAVPLLASSCSQTARILHEDQIDTTVALKNPIASLSRAVTYWIVLKPRR